MSLLIPVALYSLSLALLLSLLQSIFLSPYSLVQRCSSMGLFALALLLFRFLFLLLTLFTLLDFSFYLNFFPSLSYPAFLHLSFPSMGCPSFVHASFICFSFPRFPFCFCFYLYFYLNPYCLFSFPTSTALLSHLDIPTPMSSTDPTPRLPSPTFLILPLSHISPLLPLTLLFPFLAVFALLPTPSSPATNRFPLHSQRSSTG